MVHLLRLSTHTGYHYHKTGENSGLEKSDQFSEVAHLAMCSRGEVLPSIVYTVITLNSAFSVDRD